MFVFVKKNGSKTTTKKMSRKSIIKCDSNVKLWYFVDLNAKLLCVLQQQ